MDELANRFADLATKYGPNVVDAALGATRTEGYAILIGSVMQMLCAAALFAAALLAWNLRPEYRQTGSMSDGDARGFVSIAAWGIAGAAGILFAAALWSWLDPWTWAAINHPELWLAKRAFHI